MRRIWLLLCCGCVLLAQESALQLDLRGLQYPALARAARVQGTVRFIVKDGKAELVLGHPLLVRAAKENVEKWSMAYSGGVALKVDYNFLLNKETYVEKTVPAGNVLYRAFLRIRHKPTTKRVGTLACGGPHETTTKYEASHVDDRPVIQIEVETGVVCIG